MSLVRFADLFAWPDDQKLVYGLFEVAGHHSKSATLAPRTREWIQDLFVVNDAWYKVPNGGYTYLLETDGDPIAPLRAACERFGHLPALRELDVVRAAFPGGQIPHTDVAKKPFVELAEQAVDSVFYDESIIPMLARWARQNREDVLALDGPVAALAEPRELPAGAHGAIADHWFRAVGGKAMTSDDGVIDHVKLPRFRHDLDRVHAAMTKWRGAARIEVLDVTGTLAPYWRPIPFVAFPKLRELQAQYSGMTDSDVDALLRLPRIEECNVYAACDVSPKAKERLRDRLGDRCRL
jgi:hypothetical protein